MLRAAELDFGIFGIYTETDSERVISTIQKQLSYPQTFEKLKYLKKNGQLLLCASNCPVKLIEY